MARPVIMEWAPQSANINEIALSQTVAVNGFVNLNGNSVFLEGPNNTPTARFYAKCSRTVAIASTDDLHLNGYIVTGTYQGFVQVDNSIIAGPNNSSVETALLFDTVTSIKCLNFTSTNLSVGYGTQGHTPWCLSDYNRTLNSASWGCVITGTINYSLACTLDDVTKSLIFTGVDTLIPPTQTVSTDLLTYPSGGNNSTPFSFDITNSLKNKNTNALGSSDILTFTYFCFVITPGAGEGPIPSTGGLTITYVEGGLI